MSNRYQCVALTELVDMWRVLAPYGTWRAPRPSILRLTHNLSGRRPASSSVYRSANSRHAVQPDGWVASEKMPLITLTLIVIGIRPIQQKMGPKNTISAKYKTYKYFHQKIINLPSWKYAEQCVSLRFFRDQSDAMKPTSCMWDFAQTASNF